MLPECEVLFRSNSDSFSIREFSTCINAYNSALAWFFRTKTSRRFWASHVARIWLFEMAQTRRWLAPSQYCIRYEGDGSAAEVFRVLWSAFYRLPGILWLRFRRQGNQ